MNILAIESSQRNCQVSLKISDKVISSDSIKNQKFSSENLPIICEKLLGKLDAHFKDLDCIGVSIGPGSFTGLRVGLSYAKGLSKALKIPIIPIDTFDLMLENNSNIKKYPIHMIIHSHGKFVFYKKNNNDSNEDNSNPILESLDVLKLKKNETYIINSKDNQEFLSNFNEIKSKYFIQPSSLKIIEMIQKVDFKNFNIDSNLTPNYIASFNLESK